MARPIQSRLKISGVLESTSPLHFGALAGGIETDLPLYVDGQGRLCIPGTALTGPLRDWLRQAFAQSLDDEQGAESLLGYQREGATDELAQGMASLIMVEDAPVCDEAWPEVWDGVGIDREYGAAKDGIKFDRAILPRGTCFQFEMTVDIPPDPELIQQSTDIKYAEMLKTMPTPQLIEARVGHLLEALVRGDIRMGAAQTRGLGQIRLLKESLSIERECWGSRAGVLQTLRRQNPKLNAGHLAQLQQSDPQQQPRLPERLTITINWQPDGPVMTKAPFDGMAVDMLPFVSRNGNSISLALPGSGLKGALRSQAERIMRTLLGEDTARWNHAKTHLEQVDVPLVNELFGWAKPANQRKPPSKNLGRGWLEIATCYSKNINLRPEQWEALAWAAGSNELPQPNHATPLYEQFATAGLQNPDRTVDLPYFEQAQHVAIDRWTSAAADGFLYSAIEPFNVVWEPITLTLTLPRQKDDGLESDDNRTAVIALLLLTIGDLMRQQIPIGFGTGRGYGHMTVKEIKFENSLSGQDWLLDTVHCLDDIFAECPQEFRDNWANAIQRLRKGQTC